MNEHGRPRAALAAHAAAVAALLLAACSGPAGPTSAAHGQPSTQPSSGGATATQAAPERVLGVTTSGDLALVDPRTGTRASTIVSGVSARDEVSVTADGSTIYYEQDAGCTGRIYSVPAAGGTPTLVTAGTLPAVSPDGSRLAFAGETTPVTNCFPHLPPPPEDLLVVRDLRTGAQTTYRAAPQLTQTGLIYPIDHLSWSADGSRLLISLQEVQDNQGWNLVVLDPRTAKYYLTGARGEGIPVTGGDSMSGNYYREGVFMPDGNLFINRVCCAGNPPLRRSTLMWKVTTSGAEIAQVAVGFTDRDHTSLDVDRAGQELLYLSGSDLYVSDGGRRPRLLTTGFVAATFISTARPR
jgi:hypothetical protein